MLVVLQACSWQFWDGIEYFLFSLIIFSWFLFNWYFYIDIFIGCDEYPFAVWHNFIIMGADSTIIYRRPWMSFWQHLLIQGDTDLNSMLQLFMHDYFTLNIYFKVLWQCLFCIMATNILKLCRNNHMQLCTWCMYACIEWALLIPSHTSLNIDLWLFLWYLEKIIRGPYRSYLRSADPLKSMPKSSKYGRTQATNSTVLLETGLTF